MIKLLNKLLNPLGFFIAHHISQEERNGKMDEHVKGLQRTITNRNKQIKELKAGRQAWMESMHMLSKEYRRISKASEEEDTKLIRLLSPTKNSIKRSLKKSKKDKK